MSRVGQEERGKRKEQRRKSVEEGPYHVFETDTEERSRRILPRAVGSEECCLVRVGFPRMYLGKKLLLPGESVWTTWAAFKLSTYLPQGVPCLRSSGSSRTPWTCRNFGENSVFLWTESPWKTPW